MNPLGAVEHLGFFIDLGVAGRVIDGSVGPADPLELVDDRLHCPIVPSDIVF
jgi:hypothetical protein